MRTVEERYLSIRGRGRSILQIQIVAAGRDDKELLRFIADGGYKKLEQDLLKEVLT